MTKPEPTADDWKRLGVAVQGRRFDRRLSQEDLVKLGGPSHQTVRNIERGAPAAYRSTTFRKLDRALSWRDGTSEKILAGTVTNDELREVVVRAGTSVFRLDSPDDIDLSLREREQLVEAAQMFGEGKRMGDILRLHRPSFDTCRSAVDTAFKVLSVAAEGDPVLEEARNRVLAVRQLLDDAAAARRE